MKLTFEVVETEVQPFKSNASAERIDGPCKLGRRTCARVSKDDAFLGMRRLNRALTAEVIVVDVQLGQSSQSAESLDSTCNATRRIFKESERSRMKLV